MRSFQWEICLVMLEGRLFPVHRAVAAVAFLTLLAIMYVIVLVAAVTA